MGVDRWELSSGELSWNRFKNNDIITIDIFYFHENVQHILKDKNI